jgi:drug/metabolite transporter (DMT)-like permease
MGAQKLIGILLIVLGGLGLAYGGFSYTKETHEADVGPLHMEVKDKERVNVPVWAGISGLVVGALLLATAKKST